LRFFEEDFFGDDKESLLGTSKGELRLTIYTTTMNDVSIFNKYLDKGDTNLS
jgi:hypothetical protein